MLCVCVCVWEGVSKYAIRISFKHEHVAKILNAEISSGNTLQTAQMNRQKDNRTYSTLYATCEAQKGKEQEEVERRGETATKNEKQNVK